MRVLDLIVRSEICEALGWTIIHSFWEGLVVAGALAAVLVSFRSARIRYVAGCVGLLAIVASFTITLIHSWPAGGGSRGTMIHVALPSWPLLPEMESSNNSFSDLGTFIPWLGPVWMTGVCLFYLRYAAGWLFVIRLRRRGVCNATNSWQEFVSRLRGELKISRPVLLLESVFADTPVLLGHLRPVVLVPIGFLSGLSPHHVEAILLHELAHIRRSDYFANVCQRLLEGLVFYHPAVWWISHVIRTERENCCDDVVVRIRGDAQGYALALTALEQNRLDGLWGARASAVAATGGNLMKRIKRLLFPQGPSGISAAAVAAFVLVTSSAMVLGAWQVNAYVGAGTAQMDNKVDQWQTWLNEDVVYIISDQEKDAFERLKTHEERQNFVEQFWARRDPTPGTPENEFKKEHYRRIAYANRHFEHNLPGWKTDRGRIYIRYGPPDEIDSHPSGGSYNRPEWEGGRAAMTHPFEDWRYSHFEGVGSLSIEFVDLRSSGEFRMTLDPTEKYKNR